VNNKINFYLQWIATAITVLGAGFTAVNIYPANVIAFNLGSVLWLVYAYRIRAKSLIVVNLSMLMIYFAGTIYAAL